MFVCCECCVLSGKGLCDELITRPEESYRLWCVIVCDLEKQTSWMRRLRPTRGLSRQEREKKNLNTAVDEINAWFPSRIKNRPMKQAAGYDVNIKTGRLMTGT
jgi:hypothetical protein